jgi:hypothetical protein
MIDMALTTEFAITAGGAMTGADRVIRWSTAGAVVGVAAVAAVASYEHAYALVRAHASPGRKAWIWLPCQSGENRPSVRITKSEERLQD